jgi:endonuclease/exonuclease/phosphatase (EEP) superfamily protein YafD
LSTIIKILFWNVKRKNLTDQVCELAASRCLDVIVLNESGVEKSETLAALQTRVSSDFFRPPEFSLHDHFHCFCRSRALNLSEVASVQRLSFRRLCLGKDPVVLTLVHGLDVRNYDRETRMAFAIEMAEELRFVGENLSSERFILLGDFNMNPFDPGMNLAKGLNAMMTKNCVRRGKRTFSGKSYDFFYNPMWSLFGDNTKGPAGTIYDPSSQGPYGWNMFDQIILHHSVVSLFKDVEIVTHTGCSTLMSRNGRPAWNIASDHFPLLVTLQDQPV